MQSYTGTVNYEGNGYYWGSTVSGTNVQSLLFIGNDAYMTDYHRVDGLAVRCIKD